jgi:hypothetical protein
MANRPTYHDLHVTTPDQPRIALSNMAHGFEVSCNRAAGWCLSYRGPDGRPVIAASEYGDAWLALDVNGVIICDSRPKEAPSCGH